MDDFLTAYEMELERRVAELEKAWREFPSFLRESIGDDTGAWARALRDASDAAIFECRRLGINMEKA